MRRIPFSAGSLTLDETSSMFVFFLAGILVAKYILSNSPFRIRIHILELRKKSVLDNKGDIPVAQKYGQGLPQSDIYLWLI